MVNFTQNPHDAQAPDYASVIYDATRARLITPQLDNAAAIGLLGAIWTAENDAQRAAWDAQIAERDAADAARQLDALNDAAAAAALLAEEAAATLAEDRKKNRAKYIAAPNVPFSHLSPVLISPAVRLRLEAGKQLELWHFTRHGLDELRRNPTSVGYDDMQLAHSNDSGTVIMTSAHDLAKSKNLIPDQLLAWDDFTQAAPRLIDAMEETGWLPVNVAMFAAFFGNIQLLANTSDPEDLDELRRALLLYQAEVRTQWHNTLRTKHACNIAEICEPVLAKHLHRVQNMIHRAERSERDAECVLSLLYIFFRILC